MTRVIKFRAWDKKRKVMLKNVGFQYSDVGLLIRPEIGMMWAGTEEERVSHYEGRYGTDHELMQFTGLTDKNGKEIYEGDIVEVLDIGFGYKYLGVINWNQETLQYLLAIHGKYDTMPEGKREIPRTLEYHFFEVIGNIYENPELLK